MKVYLFQLNTVKHIRVCLYIAYIACGTASLYIKTLYFFLYFASLYIKTLYFFFSTLALAAAATVANIKIRYGAKTPQFAMFGTRVICVFYSINGVGRTGTALPRAINPTTILCVRKYINIAFPILYMKLIPVRA